MNLLSTDPIHEFFGLSYANYLVLPRALLQSCSLQTQRKLCEALEDIYHEEKENMPHHWPDKAEIVVRLKDVGTGRFITDDLANYERGRRRLWQTPDDAEKPHTAEGAPCATPVDTKPMSDHPAIADTRFLEDLTDRACRIGLPNEMGLTEFVDWLRSLYPEYYRKRVDAEKPHAPDAAPCARESVPK